MRKKDEGRSGEKATFREKLAQTFDASKEVILDAAKITMIGNREMTVENFKSILEYTESKIVVLASRERIAVLGRNLEIRSLARELIFVTGTVLSVEFKKEA